MASMVDRGDNYHVLYLGSSMLAQASTGLGVLQRPLRDLYYRYRQAGGGPAAQERYLQMSPRGLAMTFKESGSPQPTELFYDMPSILFWDAVQFVAVRGSKKIMCAFEPVDNDHSRNKDNLFQVLDKKFQFLQQMTHPPLFTCVLRRTSGVKALDLHAFVCASDEEAMGLVRALNAAQRNHAHDEVTETGVFGYQPFSGGEVPPADLRNAASRPVAHVNSPRQLVPGPTSSPSQARLGTHAYRLTQDDILPGSQPEVSRPPAPSPVASSPPRSPEHLYHYLDHIEESLPRSASRKPQNRVNAKSVFPGGVAASVAAQAKTRGLGQQERRTSPEGSSGSLPRQEVGRAQAVVRPVSLAPPKSDSSKLGQGYSLLSGSGALLPGQDGHEYSDSEESPPASPATPLSRYRASSPSYQNSLTRDGTSIPRPSLLPHYRDYEHRATDSWERRQQERPRALPRENFHSPLRDNNRFPSREELRQSPQGQPSDRFPPRREPEGRNFTPPGRTPEPTPSRPVAKVPPHKVTGVKVLPMGPMPALKPTDTTPSPGDRPRSIVYYDDTMYSSKLPSSAADQKRPKSTHHASSPGDSRCGANWQFKPPVDEDYSYHDGRSREPDGDKSDPVMNEKLLMNQKKDAEIASLMHNLRFEYDGKTMSPGMPAGNNFEKSLGYFPWSPREEFIRVIIGVTKSFLSIDQSHKSHSAAALYPTMHHSEQKCAHFCSEWCIVGYGAAACGICEIGPIATIRWR